MDDRRLLNPGNYVIVANPIDDRRSGFVIDKVDGAIVYIHPEDNVNKSNAIVFINGEWKVKGAEHINYKITFESSSHFAALPTVPTTISFVTTPSSPSSPVSSPSSPPTGLDTLTGNEVYVVEGYAKCDETYPETDIRVAGNLESALILAYKYLVSYRYYDDEDYYNKDWSYEDINIEDRQDLYDEFVKYMTDGNLDSQDLRDDSYNNVGIFPVEVETPSQTLIKSARFH